MSRPKDWQQELKIQIREYPAIGGWPARFKYLAGGKDRFISGFTARKWVELGLAIITRIEPTA